MKERGLDNLPSEERRKIEKELVEARLRQTSNRGRPPMDPVLMLKVVLLGVIHRLSDAQLSFDIADRSTFRAFLRLPPGVQISRSVIWKYREIWLFRLFGERTVCRPLGRGRKQLLVEGFALLHL